MESIIYRKDRIVLFAGYGDPAFHRHFAKHILVSDKPFICTVEGKENRVSSVIIRSQVKHSVKTEDNSKMVVFFIDETSALSKQLNNMYLSGNNEAGLPAELESKIVQLIKNGNELEEIDRLIMESLCSDRPYFSHGDERILRVLEYIENSESLNQEIYDRLSAMICLSKSRFLHLFKENMGIDLKNYLLLKKMEKTYCYVTEKQMTITEAAVTAGFSSPSHFSEACKQHYGISLTDFLRAQNI